MVRELTAQRVVYTVTNDEDGAQKNYFHLKAEGFEPKLELRSEMADPPRLEGKYVVWYYNQPVDSARSNSPKPIEGAVD